MSADGAGLRNVTVDVTSMSGETVTVRTNAFGQYRFDNITAGATYPLTARARGMTFPSRAIVVTDTLSGEDIVANR
jgi:hypothetical protein